MVEKRVGKKPTKKEIKAKIDKGFNSLDDALDRIIEAVDEQGMEILADTLKLAKKIAKTYKVAHINMLKKM